ncbi:MAG: hypothetical protein ABI947_11680 [Chloroflexota bacterium]
MDERENLVAQGWEYLSQYGSDKASIVKDTIALASLFGFEVVFNPEQKVFYAYFPSNTERDFISISASETSFTMSFKYGGRFSKPATAGFMCECWLCTLIMRGNFGHLSEYLRENYKRAELTRAVLILAGDNQYLLRYATISYVDYSSHFAKNVRLIKILLDQTRLERNVTQA